MSDDKQRLLAKLDALEAGDRPDDMPRGFGPYLLLTSLARGGMGEVFLARSGGIAGLEKHCVVKTLRPQFTDDREYVSRFVDEARIVVQLGHRTICQVFDVGAVDGRFYLAMEHIAGKDLRNLEVRLQERGLAFPLGLAIHVLSEVLEALDYAHRHEDHAGNPLFLVHRDVSPQNVMISYEGEVKLIDFGLAASTLKMEQTSPNVVMGKLAYMSPEQVRGDKLDGRADLFACGVMLYELLTGERYYEGKTAFEIWSIAATGKFRPRKWNDLDPDLRAILDRALAGERHRRVATCAELREELQHWRHAHAVQGDGPALRRVMSEAFGDDQRAFKERLRGLSSSKVPRSPSLLPSESTQSIARAARSLPADAPTMDDLPAINVPALAELRARELAPPPSSSSSSSNAITEPTAVIVRELRRPARRFAAIAAVCAAVGALAVAVVVVVGPSSRQAAPLPAPVAVAPAEPSPLVLLLPPPPPVAPTPSPPVVVPAEVIEPVPVVPPAPLKRPPPRPPTPKPPAQVTKPPLRVAPWEDLTKRQRLDAIAQLCPHLPCIAALRPRLETFGGANMVAFTKDLNSCRAACGRL